MTRWWIVGLTLLLGVQTALGQLFEADSKRNGSSKMDIVVKEIERRERSSVMDITITKVAHRSVRRFFSCAVFGNSPDCEDTTATLPRSRTNRRHD
jgi:hypothetical protein